MTEVSRTVGVPPDRVFAVLADGWSYAAWVVGNSHIRGVDPEWPSVGARIHHSAGLWPIQFKDWTEVTALVPGRMIELRARLWPLGAGTVRFDLTATSGGTRIVMGERATDGPVALLPGVMQGLLLRARNHEVLRRLADLAAGRPQP
ncbi:SRPBCC family protein [Kutzneria buriramensis]|uniref:Polyketide cyclase/dehydrase/lipid transport protein n=1 Tax=Kutzneria buriramensis TaxID=1045776 RepID=A0A3E0H758_9PSEU|nr:SRPBCC family protein [Kutzneria buriramensis]REH39290.1 polyketide cyclase/dehydrase/lipid transport protein [Kutzneria buriramensis]